MKEKARDLIYLDTERYISLSGLKKSFKATLIFPAMMIVLGIMAVNANGFTFRAMFPMLSGIVWSLLYYIFISVIESEKTKKTFELRFLVNGISGTFLSVLFWLLYTSYNLIADKPPLGRYFFMWILPIYLLFSVLYVGLIVLGAHKGVFGKIKEKSRAQWVIALDAVIASVIPIAGVLGMHTSKMLRNNADVSMQNVCISIALITIIFLSALAHINFVQYFYCKKYKIVCDENGDTTSPKLCR